MDFSFREKIHGIDSEKFSQENPAGLVTREFVGCATLRPGILSYIKNNSYLLIKTYGTARCRILFSYLRLICHLVLCATSDAEGLGEEDSRELARFQITHLRSHQRQRKKKMNYPFYKVVSR